MKHRNTAQDRSHSPDGGAPGTQGRGDGLAQGVLVDLEGTHGPGQGGQLGELRRDVSRQLVVAQVQPEVHQQGQGSRQLLGYGA